MTNNWQNIKKVIQYSPGGVVSKELFKSKNASVTLFCLAQNTGLSEHTSTREGFVYVMEGEGEFNLKGENIKMLPEVLIYMEKNAVHSLQVKENTSFILFLND